MSAQKKEELSGIVGPENVSDEPETLESYSRDQSFVLPMKPRLVVKPKKLDEIQAIVRWANETRTPLVPVSSGPPHFNGDTVPGSPGSVILNLSRMDRIIRIDRRNRMALIEPGVTYSQLQPELAKEGLKLSTPLLPRANKSVIASLLERQPTLVPKYQWSLPDPLRSLEVVWGNGEMMWTGDAGAGPRSLEKQWEKGLAQVDAMGPAQTDWYRIVSGAQGTMGVVTWASVRCEVLPKVHKLFFVPAQELDDLIACAYSLLRVRLGDEFLLLNSLDLACVLAEGDQVRVLREELPPWVILLGLAGRDILSQERVEVDEKDLRDIVQQHGLRLETAIPGARSEPVLDALLQPSEEPYWQLGYKGDCHNIFFLTTLDKTPQFVKLMKTLASRFKYPSADIGIYLQPQHQGVACHCEFSLYSDHRVELAKAEELFRTASEELIKQGAFFSRPYPVWADMVYNRDAASTILLKKIKNIFDPNNILNPGKLCF